MISTIKIEMELATRDSAPDGVAEQTATMMTTDPDGQEFLLTLADVVQRADDCSLRVHSVDPGRIVFHRNGGA